ncbi:unnamed protein product [Chilo suppressalis]|uniref:Cyclic nucleotide-binding domain-containing protein n=1 Tax=Chilo suppressalis TaxID=168631 RepID=A0ABN8BDF8_CHISP|nr:unnamed protein product [Chilo suppressalis]
MLHLWWVGVKQAFSQPDGNGWMEDKWNALPAHVFPPTYNLESFKRAVNKQHAGRQGEDGWCGSYLPTYPKEVLFYNGGLQILDPDTKRVVGTLRVKNHFGVIECLLRLPAYYTVRAATHVQVFSISKKVLSRAMDLPQIKDAIEFAKERPEYSRLLLSRESFQSYEPLAPAPNTERFLLPRKYERDYDFRQPFKRLGFFSILRYIFPRFTIRPDGAYLMRYEWFRGACALLGAAVFPSYTYLELQWPALYFVALLLDLAAYFDMSVSRIPSYKFLKLQWAALYLVAVLLDLAAYFVILQRMLVGYFNAEGALVFHPASTTAHYLKGAFFVDLLACLPLENLESPLLESAQDNHRTKSRQFLMLNRLLQLYRLRSAMLCLDEYIERRDILLVIKAIPLYIVILNTMTSLMVLASVCFYVADSGESTIAPFHDKGGSWIYLFGDTFRFNLTESPWNLHLATYFWVVYATTTTGYGCFQPSNLYIITVLFVGMVLSSMMTTYLSVRIISVRAKVNKQLAAYQEHIKDIVVFMEREHLPKNLQKEVLDYYEYNWEKTGGIDYTSVLKLCDQITLRTDAILHIYGRTFEKCPFLAECDVSLLRIIGRAVRSTYFLRDMMLVDIDDVIADLYFVDEGVLAVKDSTSSSSTIAVLTKGSVFGNLDNLPTVRCSSAITAQSMVHVLHIDAVTFHQIISDFPQVAKDMETFRSEEQSFIMGRVEDISISRKEHAMSTMMLFLNNKRLSQFFYKDKYIQTYLMVISLACVYADVYNAGFQHNTTSFVAFLYALDVCFYLKILMYYSLPYLANSVHTKKALIPIKQSYMKNELKYDIVSCFPTELMCFAFQNHRWMVFSWLRLNRLFRIVTAYRCLSRHRERIIVNLMLSTVLTVLIWFTLIIHTMVCMWYFIGVLQDMAEPNSSWMHKNDGGSWCHNMYICSMYFVLTTFTQNGVGDIMPKNQPEVIFVSVMQIVAMLLYMIFVGEFSNMIQFSLYRCFSFYSKYLELQEFLKNNRVSKNLVSMVNEYSLHLWRESRGMQVPCFLQAAPQALRLRIMSATYMHHLTQNPVFKECEPAFLRQLVGCLQLYTYDEGLYVVRKTEITDSMYMIHNGRVQEITSSPQEDIVYKSSEYFGLEQGLFYDTPFPNSYRTVIKSQVLTLKLGDWAYLLKHFPKTKNSIYKHFNRYDDSSNDKPETETAYNNFNGNSRFDSLNNPSDKFTQPEDTTDIPTKPILPESISDKRDVLNPVIADIPALHSNAATSSFHRSSKGELENITSLVDSATHVGETNEIDLRTPDKANVGPTEDKQEFLPHKIEQVMNNNNTQEFISESNQSPSSLPTTSRGPRDVEEAIAISSTLIKKIETKAKELFDYKKDSKTYVTDDESISKDNLLIEKDEEATTALLKEFSEKTNSTINLKDETNKNEFLKDIDISDANSVETLDLEALEQKSILTIEVSLKDNMLAIVANDEAKQIREEVSTQAPKLKEFRKKANQSKSHTESNLSIRDADGETESAKPDEEA